MLLTVRSVAANIILASYLLTANIVAAQEFETPEPSINPHPAVGFHLGPSYGFAAVHFSNGTRRGIVNIEGDEDYRAVIHDLVAGVPVPSQWWHFFYHPDHDSTLIRAAKSAVFLPIRRDERTTQLARMIWHLRAETEQVLQQRLVDNVAISVPYIRAWQGHLPFQSVINDALAGAGLEARHMGINAPTYLHEANAALKGHGLRECLLTHCRMVPDEKKDLPYDSVFYISYTFSSLYTLFQDNECFFEQNPTKRRNIVEPSLGHDQAKLSESGAVFFKGVKDHLVAELNKDIEATESTNPDTSYAVVVAGEAATHSEFLSAVTQAIDEVVGSSKRKVGQVKILDVYAPALGTADWIRRSMNRGYCLENPVLEERDREIRKRRASTSSSVEVEAAESTPQVDDARDEL